MNIELFPAEKTCEQGCSICPLAKKDSGDIPYEINATVQETFSLLEERLMNESRTYQLHFTSNINLFPEVKFPELISYTRFETSKEIKVRGGVKKFSRSIQNLLASRKINLKTLAYSLVPEHPMVSRDDMYYVEELFSELSSWFLVDGYKNISITLRSNLIKNEIFNFYENRFYANDQYLFLKFLKTIGYERINPKRRRVKGTASDGNFYFNEHLAKKGRWSLKISNRVITAHSIPSDKKSEFHLDQAIAYYPYSVRRLHFSIAPRGVMFGHSSLNINNPVLWVSHEDFRAMLKSNKSFKKGSQDLIKQNAGMYKWIQDQKGESLIKISDYTKHFQDIRKQAFV